MAFEQTGIYLPVFNLIDKFTQHQQESSVINFFIDMLY